MVIAVNISSGLQKRRPYLKQSVNTIPHLTPVLQDLGNRVFCTISLSISVENFFVANTDRLYFHSERDAPTACKEQNNNNTTSDHAVVPLSTVQSLQHALGSPFTQEMFYTPSVNKTHFHFHGIELQGVLYIPFIDGWSCSNLIQYSSPCNIFFPL